jgi:hypothetical protein
MDSSIRYVRRVGGAVILGVVALLVTAAVASAATAPTLDSPAGGASFTEGGKIAFNWSGALQGDSTALDRSYFRVELVPSSRKPAAAQASWTTVSDYLYGITDYGENDTSLDLGVPSAGTWAWRVCAWGVVDDTQDNSIEQLSDGCSGARTMTTVAATKSQKAIGEVGVTNSTTVAGPNNYVTKTTTTVEQAKPAKNTVVTLPKTDDQTLRVDVSDLGSTYGENGKSSVNLGSDGFGDLAGETDDASGGAFGVMSRFAGKLGEKLPIPWWSLALLVAAIPLARIWRSTTLNMFEFDNGDSEEASAGIE